MNIIQFNYRSKEKINEILLSLNECLKQEPKLISYAILDNNTDLNSCWELRKKGVGLLGKTVGKRKPIAFIEDTVVPIENLESYIIEFQSLLDSVNLDYAIYGHVDAGCLHIRPSLDLCNEFDRQLIKQLSADVFRLLQKYNGIMWGEHGRGFRSQFGPETFGKQLFSIVEDIKTFFDPENKLNPGKIASSKKSPITLKPIDSKTKGHFDESIDEELKARYEQALNCNGNGACFNYQTQHIMCPSYKLDWDRVHSPKGRSQLLREWMHQLSQTKAPTLIERFLGKKSRRFNKQDFSHEVYDSMSSCLSCKACATACPVNIDISNLKSKFLEQYYSRYYRPIKDYIIGNIERLLLLTLNWPNWVYFILINPINNFILKLIGIVDIPKPQKLKLSQLKDIGNISNISWKNMSKLNVKKNSIILIPDLFTYFFRSGLIIDYCKVLDHLNYNIMLSPPLKTGKPLHIKGFLKAFKKEAKNTSKQLKLLEKLNCPLLGIDPAMTLTFRDEYTSTLRKDELVNVQLFQEWASNQSFNTKKERKKTAYLLGHCSEKTLIYNSSEQWKTVLKKFGITLKSIESGCCGMAGTFGHEKKHLDESKKIYQQNWHAFFNQEKTIITTGFSCYEQVKRYSNKEIKHPISLLASHLNNS